MDVLYYLEREHKSEKQVPIWVRIWRSFIHMYRVIQKFVKTIMYFLVFLERPERIETLVVDFWAPQTMEGRGVHPYIVLKKQDRNPIKI